jgi:hypothetical protein
MRSEVCNDGEVYCIGCDEDLVRKFGCLATCSNSFGKKRWEHAQVNCIFGGALHRVAISRIKIQGYLGEQSHCCVKSVFLQGAMLVHISFFRSQTMYVQLV